LKTWRRHCLFFIPLIKEIIYDYKYASHLGQKLEVNWEDPDSVFYYYELQKIIYDIEYVIDKILDLKRPIIAKGRLYKGPDGYYLLDDVPVPEYDCIEICIEERVILRDCTCELRTWVHDCIVYENWCGYFNRHRDLALE